MKINIKTLQTPPLPHEVKPEDILDTLKALAKHDQVENKGPFKDYKGVRCMTQMYSLLDLLIVSILHH